MENNPLLPFERNRYYVGKLLTSADFQTEQNYEIHKRRFYNDMLFGSGIVCGLGVYSLDDLSIMVDSGMAVDGLGRDIAVESAVVKKLSALDGFETLTSDLVTLCLRYVEESVHPVYAVRGQESGEAYECNRIREGWQLFLQNSEDLMPTEPAEPEFLSSSVLYTDDDYQVTCTMPSLCCCGTAVRLDVTVERFNPAAAPLSLSAEIQTPAFLSDSADHALHLDLREIAPETALTLHYWLFAQSQPSPDSVLLAGTETIHVRVGEEARSAEENFLLKAVVTALSASEIIDQAVASVSLETKSFSGNVDFVALAEISLQRTRSAYLIESINGTGVRRYIRTPAADHQREALSGWFRTAAPTSTSAPALSTEDIPSERFLEPVYATGTCEIPMGANTRRGQVIYSDEIIHGLGLGTVHVTVGSEYLADDPKLGYSARNTIYGDSSLFASPDIPIAPADTAVKVMNDRGSFVVAARLREDTTMAVLTLRWVALYMPGGKEDSKLRKLAGKSIAALQPTVVMSTRESHYFSVRFKNMEPCTLTYELTEKDSGEITSDGIYTAPGREGVFEIRISCAEMPLVSTYAYAVVKKRDIEQAEEPISK